MAADADETIGLLYTEAGPSTKRSPIENADLGYPLADTPGGGDCMFYALGKKAAEIKEARALVADAMRYREDDSKARTANAHHVVLALSQTPATRDTAVALTYGRHEIPTSVYAKLVPIPGIYAGEEELKAYSSLLQNQGMTFLVVDSDGTLAEIKNGKRTALDYTNESKAKVLSEALARADIALYKTPDHWQRIIKPESKTFGEELRESLKALENTQSE
jgi:hypothetical protein